MAVPSSRVRRLCRRNRKRKFVLVPAIIESFLIKRRRFAKVIFIYRDFGQSFVNGLWDVFDDAGWMVRFLVDVQWNVSWFVVCKCLPLARLSVTSRKFTTFLLASIVIFRPCLAKMLHATFKYGPRNRGSFVQKELTKECSGSEHK